MLWWTCAISLFLLACSGTKLNQVQLLGTRNSYKVAPDPLLVEVVGDVAGLERAWALNYTFEPIENQLCYQGIRQLELDVYADSEGGLFATRLLPKILRGFGFPDTGAYVGDDFPSMLEPGFKVLHIPDVDFNTTALTLEQALVNIKLWMKAQPQSFPIIVHIEAKERGLKEILSEAVQSYIEGIASQARVSTGIANVEKFGRRHLDTIDKLIVKVFGTEGLITPDHVIKNYSSLEEAVLHGGWPTVSESRGKVMFVLDADGSCSSEGPTHTYLEGHETAKGRVMFAGKAEPGCPASGYVIVNNAVGGMSMIRSLVEKGYIVRTITESEPNNSMVRENDLTTVRAALKGGAQVLSTAYPVPAPEYTGSKYVVNLPTAAGSVVRCNPVSGNGSCEESELLEKVEC